MQHRHPLIGLTLALAIGAAACGGDPATSPTDTADMSALDMSADLSVQDMGTPLRPALRQCTSAPLPPEGPDEDWRHTASSVITLADPDHSAQDVITADTRDAEIVGKFAYGAVSKDLEDERVEVFMDDCSGAYVRLGEVLTDSDGRIALPMRREDLPAPGVYGLFLRVKGDQSFTRSALRVLPEQTRLMVFDIDGTLTTKDAEIFQDALADYFEPIYSGEVVPESRQDAVAITQLRAAQGYQLVYLTGRPYVLTRITREWLAGQGYAPGHLHVTNSNSEVLPTTGGVGSFKRAYLLGLQAQGLVLDAAYGNAETDIYAYGEAQVPRARTWIAGEYGGEAGTQAVGDDYTAHVPVARQEPNAAQPFALVP